MTLFKKLQDLNGGINRLNKKIDPELVLTENTDDLLESICTVLENESYFSYYANKFVNSRIELFTFKGAKLDISLESKFIVDIYKDMYGRDEVVAREFLQFIYPLSYKSRDKWVVGSGIFKYWCLGVSIKDNKLTAYIYIDHDIICDVFSDLEDEDLVPTIYDFRELKFPKISHARIVALLNSVKGKISTDQVEQYQELCSIFINK